MALLRLSHCNPTDRAFGMAFRVALISGCTDSEISAIMQVQLSTIQKWRLDYE